MFYRSFAASLGILCLLGVAANAGFRPWVFTESPRTTTFVKSIFAPSASTGAADGKISPELLRDIAGAEKASAVLLLSDQADLSDAYRIDDHEERGWFVFHTLSKHAREHQAPLRAYLDQRGISYKPFWAANMIVAEVDQATLLEIAGRSDVARVDSNRSSRWIELPDLANLRTDTVASPNAVEWGVSSVNAPALWSLGYTGSGIVVGGLDTGIRWSHNAIKSKYRGWNGTVADHNYNWHDAIHSGGGVCGANTTEPCDDDNHGSHTVGTMVGDDGNGNQIGVAPGAKWIGCRNMNVGDGTPASYAECFQFMIAPTDLAGNNPNPALRPHILNNSWGCTTSEGCTTRAELELIVNNTLAAGIFVQSSAGNTGSSGCSSVSQALAIYDATFAAGAIDSNNSLLGLSSRGPSTFYNPNILKPNIAAPGANVRSIGRASDTTYNFSTGTSMASPHVAGVVALLWSARPSLSRNIAATKALLQSTANPSVSVANETCGGIPSTQIPNNSFGYGRVDALAAYEASATPINVSGRVVSPEGSALRNVTIRLIDALGRVRTATTSSFGIYSFDNVRGSETYTLTASSKRYRFVAQVATVSNEAFSVSDFVGLQ
jgi:serine protease AprX